MDQQYVYLINKTTPVNSAFMNDQHSGVRLRFALRSSGHTPSAFAQAMNISNQTLNNWFVRGIPGRRILTIAKFLDLQPEWLESGKGSPLTEQQMQADKAFLEASPEQLEEWRREANVVSALQPTRAFSYPEISWVQAGSPSEAMVVTEIAACPKHTTDVWAGEEAFWLRVTGSSMTSTSDITFPENYLILVAPDVEPRPGQFVVARMKDSNEATFKQLVKDAGDLYLKPLNTAFPIKRLDENWEIVGTVVDGKMPKSIFF